MAIVSILLSVVSVFAFVKGDVFCDTNNACRSGNYRCDQREGCLISCTGEYSCQDSTFTCKYGCDVECFNDAACVDSTFEFETEVSSLHCKGSNACTDATVLVYNDTTLEVTCDGQNSCEDGIIEVYDEARFSIECSGQDACELLRCVCNNGGNCETSGNIECSDAKMNPKEATHMKIMKQMKKHGKMSFPGGHVKNQLFKDMNNLQHGIGGGKKGLLKRQKAQKNLLRNY